MEEITDAQNSAGTPRAWTLWAAPGFVLLCWLLAIRHLSSDWSLSEQYHYGWVVPLLTLYVCRMRLENSPKPEPTGSVSWIVGGFSLIAIAEALLLPVHEANADWRILGWALTALAAVATFFALWLVGGLVWVRHFTFPVLFFFTAVPWPRPVEIEVMWGLMQHNAEVGAEVLHWLGVTATVQGNLIRLSTQTLGIDEACSGIRSLQGALMATLFVGEIFELRFRKRLLLMIAGLVWAMVTNVGRTVALAVITEQGGQGALDRWHDPAGYWTLAVCVAGVTGFGWLLGRNSRRAPLQGSKVDSPYGKGRLSCVSGAAGAGILLICLGWAGTEWWFRLQERSVTRLAGWTFTQPTGAEHFEPVKESKNTRGELRYDSYAGGRWQDPDGSRWVANYFRWNPGRNAVRTILVHDPRTCLGASGKVLVKTLEAVKLQVGDLELLFDAYWFQDQGEDVFVFNGVAEDVRRGSGLPAEGNEITMASRLAAVLAGKRNLGQRRLEVAVWGKPDATSARKSFEELLSRQVVVKETPAD